MLEYSPGMLGVLVLRLEKREATWSGNQAKGFPMLYFPPDAKLTYKVRVCPLPQLPGKLENQRVCELWNLHFDDGPGYITGAAGSQ